MAAVFFGTHAYQVRIMGVLAEDTPGAESNAYTARYRQPLRHSGRQLLIASFFGLTLAV
jgi:hypothetical protein